MAFLLDEEEQDIKGTYKSIKVIGHGAFGEVLLALNIHTGQHVALKQLYLPEPGAPLPAAVAREVSALQQLQHPNIIALLEVITSGCCVYLCQELCCTDLAAVLAAANQQLPAKLTCNIMRQLLSALAACHAAGVMHRDIKPSNILLTASGAVKLADFGLAKTFRQHCYDAAGSKCPFEQLMAASAHGSSNLSLQHAGTTTQASRGLQDAAQPQSLPQDTPQVQPEPHSMQQCPQSCHTGGQGTRWYRAPELLYGARMYGPAVDLWAAGMVFAEVLGLTPLIPGHSDIDQLARMQHKLGSITPDIWPAVEQLPDWHKVSFAHSAGQPLAVLLPDAPPDALDLLQLLVAYDPDTRLPAAAALQHRYFEIACQH